MSTFLGVPILIRGRPFGNLYLADKLNGLEFDEGDEHALALLAEFAGVAIDHARRYTDAEAARRELQQTVEALDATVKIAQALGGETELEPVLGLVAKRGRALVSARALVIEHRRHGELVVAAVAGELPTGLIGRRLCPDDSVAAAALRSRTTQRLEDEPNRERFARSGLGRHGFQAAGGMVVPLLFRGRGYGAIVAVDRLQDGPGFHARDQRLLEAFASSAATAIATADSVEGQRRSQRLDAAEQERARWARELHDETLQGLAAVRLQLAAAIRNGDAPATPVRDAIASLEHDIAALRSLIADLRPATLDRLGLEAALETLAARSRGLGLEVSVSFAPLHGPGRYAPDLETAIYRIVQEALTNARTHGGAQHAGVRVEESGNTIRVSVQDDGRGFDPTAPSGGFGLVGMRERAGLLAGTVDVDSTPGAGATVTAVLPSG
jgi:signal transduction histidine kinase